MNFHKLCFLYLHVVRGLYFTKYCIYVTLPKSFVYSYNKTYSVYPKTINILFNEEVKLEMFRTILLIVLFFVKPA